MTRKILYVALATLTILLAGALLWQVPTPQVLAQDETQPDATAETMRTISVSGTGQVEAQPDTAIVTLGVQTDAETAGDAMAQNSQQMQDLIDALESAGVDQQDIQTQQLSLQPRYDNQAASNASRGPSTQQSSQPELIGYTAVNTVQVRSEDLENLGELLDAAVAAGGNRIDSIGFQVSNSSELLDQAREAAWNDAQSKAEQLAGLAGVELGGVLTISESSQTPFPMVRQSTQFESAAAVPVQPGTQSVQANVNVTWLLQEATQ